MMFVLLLILPVVRGVNVTVVTSKGSVVGQRSVSYDAFLGVPYARVNEDRPFEDTIQYNFTKPFDASDATIMCPQVRTEGGVIQCLRLNIHVPTNRTQQSLIPVFVWYHGGGFIMGNAGQYNPVSLIKHGIIVVTANYRLGPYGFLCVDGIQNQGLKDQKNALRWIKDNIEAFGGDKNNVTIGGQSYGGGAVDFHLYSNEKLFNNVIIGSGSKYAYGIETIKDNRAPIILAQRLGSDTKEIDRAIHFLNKANPIDVMKATKDLNLHFGVCANNETKDKFSDRIKNTSILIGYNSKEDFARFAIQNESFYENIGDIFYTNLNKTFNHNFTHLNLSDTVKSFYLDGKDISKESMLELVDFSSDFKLNYAVERSVNSFLKHQAKVYKYLFSYTGGSPYKNMTGVGAYHTEELKYIFDMSPKLSEEQRLIKEKMITMWANFIKFGDPTPKQTKLLPVKWTPTNSATRPYLNIDVKMEMMKHVYHQRMAFWDLLWTFS